MPQTNLRRYAAPYEETTVLKYHSLCLLNQFTKSWQKLFFLNKLLYTTNGQQNFRNSFQYNNVSKSALFGIECKIKWFLDELTKKKKRFRFPPNIVIVYRFRRLDEDIIVN